jgi:hypothetical protein
LLLGRKLGFLDGKDDGDDVGEELGDADGFSITLVSTTETF